MNRDGNRFSCPLLSPASLTSQWCKHETGYALQLAARSHRSNVIPVVIALFARDALPPQLANIQCCRQDRPKPSFLILLGDRYGRRPLPETCRSNAKGLALHP